MSDTPSRVGSTNEVRSTTQSGDGGSNPTPTLHLDKSLYEVRPCPLKDGQVLVTQYHYSRGGSNTAVYMHGLYGRATGELVGVAWWLPPTRVACESVNKAEWKRVLSLTRLVCIPGAPKNSASFLLAHSVRLIRRDARFVSLVTYADESQGHIGQIYRASNWTYVGRTGPMSGALDLIHDGSIPRRVVKSHRRPPRTESRLRWKPSATSSKVLITSTSSYYILLQYPNILHVQSVRPI